MKSYLSSALLLVFLRAFYVSALAASPSSLPNLKAAVLVPGFLTGANEFRSLAESLTDRGIPTVAVPMPNWHWIPCLGGRSMRPILERLDFTVRHAAAGNFDTIPPYDYSVIDCYNDFWDNPGGIRKVGGSDRVEEYPIVQPRGRFPLPTTEEDDSPPQGKIALIGHSAGGWISRIYLSERNYGGRIYNGHDLVHSLVTLGTPHASAPGPAFVGVEWCNQEDPTIQPTIRKLAVGGTGFLGGDWGALTQGSYAFCCEQGTDIGSVDGDGITPIQSALAWKGAEQLVVDGVTHFCWTEVAGSNIVAPELTKDQRENNRPWYGSDSVLDQWASWLDVV